MNWKNLIALKTIRSTILMAMLITICQCTYKFEGDVRLPSKVNRLSVDLLDNRTSETGLENIFTNALIDEFSQRIGNVLTSRDKADAILSGCIQSMRIATIARTSLYTSYERRVTLNVLITLTDRNGNVLWTSGELTDNEEYQVDSDKITTERYRKDALTHLVERLAETVYNLISSDF